jgi:hypothetical protein
MPKSNPNINGQPENVFRQFRNLNVLVAGDLILDQYIWGKVERISPEAPVPIVAVSHKENRLGGAGNVAANLAALECPSLWPGFAPPTSPAQLSGLYARRKTSRPSSKICLIAALPVRHGSSPSISS